MIVVEHHLILKMNYKIVVLRCGNIAHNHGKMNYEQYIHSLVRLHADKPEPDEER